MKLFDTWEDTMDVSLNLFDLPWQDVVYLHIFPKLHLTDLFRLRVASKTSHRCITWYLAVMKQLSLTYTGPKFNTDHLTAITRTSYMIQDLDLSAAKQWLQNDIVINIIRQNTSMETINIRGCVMLRLGLLEAIGMYCKQLKKANFGSCIHITDQEVLKMTQECTKLEHLDLSGCWNINNNTIIRTVHMCKQLRHIDLSNVYSITDVAISAIAYSCPELNVLLITACWRVTNDSIKMLGEYCKHLRILHVKDCRSITDVSLARLRARHVLIDIPMRGFTPNTKFSNAFQNAERKMDTLFSTLKLQI